MKNETSLYLDLVRFISALVVFLGHAAGKLTGGFLWQLNDYLSAAVMIFFVLSGYVIAFVYDNKEKTFISFSFSRISRFYSVAVPALLLTALCDYIGITINYDLYYGGPWPAPQNDFINYFLSFFFIQNVWGIHLNPGINVPFWSLTFEFGFYFLFAFFVFFKGLPRFFLLLLLSALLGPDVLGYLPIWLIGFFIYFLHKRIQHLNTRVSLLFFIITSLILFIATPTVYSLIWGKPGFMIADRNVYADYVICIVFAANLFFANYCTVITSVLLKFKLIITFAAGCSFSLYLFHRPLIQLFAAMELGDPTSIVNRLAVIGGTLVVVYTIGYWCESQRFLLKRLLYSAISYKNSFSSKQ
jgi:peptidoglycan/LPS O-acetylase OafA/YrhL